MADNQVKIVRSRHVADALIKLGFTEQQIHPRDAEVALLDEKGIALFGKRFASWLWRTQINAGTEAADCDDYSSWAANFARLDHAIWHSNLDCGIAFGEVWYIDNELGGHAINFSAHSEGEEIKIKLWEPQVQWNQAETRQVSMSEVSPSRVSRWLFCSF